MQPKHRKSQVSVLLVHALTLNTPGGLCPIPILRCLCTTAATPQKKCSRQTTNWKLLNGTDRKTFVYAALWWNTKDTLSATSMKRTFISYLTLLTYTDEWFSLPKWIISGHKWMDIRLSGKTVIRHNVSWVFNPFFRLYCRFSKYVLWLKTVNGNRRPVRYIR